MKRMILSILTIALVLITMATPALAAGPRQGQHFTDLNNDGICDNRQNPNSHAERNGYRFGMCRMDDDSRICIWEGKQDCPRYTDEDGDGICDNRGAGYTDEDNDGICDNRGAGHQGSGQGRRRGRNR